jgi:hypothetical protein
VYNFLTLFFSLFFVQFSSRDTHGVVELRSDVDMFWWLYEKDTAGAEGLAPLLISLPDMTGASATARDNLGGWSERANVLVVDSPVAGSELLPQNDAETVDDLLGLLRAVFTDANAKSILESSVDTVEQPHVETLRVFISAEGYGARHATLLGQRLQDADTLEALFHNMAVRPHFEGLVLIAPIIDMELALHSWPSALERLLPVEHDAVSSLAEVGRMSHERAEAHDYANAVELFEVAEGMAKDMCNGTAGISGAQETLLGNSSATILESMLDPAQSLAAMDAFAFLVESNIRVAIMVGSDDFAHGSEHVQMLLKKVTRHDPDSKDFFADAPYVPFRLRRRKAATASSNGGHVMSAQTSSIGDIDYSVHGDEKGKAYSSGSVTVYEIAFDAVADDSSTAKEIANSAMGVTTAVESGVAEGLLCNGDGITSIAEIQRVLIAPAPCCSIPQTPLQLDANGATTWEAVTFTNASMHRLTILNKGVSRIIEKPVTSGAAPQTCGAFTIACNVGDFCDVFNPSVSFWGFSTGCTLSVGQTLPSLTYKTGARPIGSEGAYTIKYEVWVTPTKRLACAIASGV